MEIHHCQDFMLMPEHYVLLTVQTRFIEEQLPERNIEKLIPHDYNLSGRLYIFIQTKGMIL